MLLSLILGKNLGSSSSQNAFSNRLQPLGFNFFEMLVVDLLHEFELGVWKALFIHLLQILEAVNPALLHQLDQRYAYFSIILYLSPIRI
jgi:hypothetical protein